MAAAMRGGKAGAVSPLKKVVRSAAVAAVKKARKISMAAAEKAVHKVLADQEKIVKKAAKKWTKTAIEKFPPTILLARRTNTPNHFTAPPTIHLGGMMEEAHPKKKHHKKAAKHAKHAKKHAAKAKKHAKKSKAHKKAAKKHLKAFK